MWGPYRDGLELVVALERARAEGAARIMLTGPCPAREWFTGRAAGWSVVRLFPDHETPAARYRHDGTGHELEVRRAAEWFGEGPYTWADAREAWTATAGALQASGRGGAVMFRSPGATGLDLWLRSSGGDVPEPLDETTQDLIRSTSPQHRIELVPPVVDVAPALWVVDGRWMYAALLRELGTGPVTMLTAALATEHAETYPHARARYYVRWKAPTWWGELGWPGLLMAKAGPAAADGWHTPPEGEAWVDAAELQLARAYEWETTILEGIAFTRGRPLDTWADRLIRARETTQGFDVGETVGKMTGAAVRSILLHTIGSWHASGRAELVVTASPMQRPDGDGWEPPERLDDGQALWRRPSPRPSPRALSMRHPEWSSQVWGRAHARILEGPTGNPAIRSGALHVPVGSLVGIYGDAIVTTARPVWADVDDGKPGRLRVKAHLCGPVPWPTTAGERDELVRQATENGTRCERGCA